MARVITKAEIMMLYKVRFGDKALLQSIQQSYTIKEYEKRISAYDTIFSVASDSKKRKIYGELSDVEQEVLDVDFPDLK